MPPPIDLFHLFVSPLNQLGLAYMVTGSAASMAYGEPRLTLDVDLVVELPENRLADLVAAFPDDQFYCPPLDVLLNETKRDSKGHFNIIHMDSGFKADFYPMGRDELHRWGMAHRRHVDLDGLPVMLAPPEYVILRKLQYFREGGSEKHLRDIGGMLRLQSVPLDRSMIANWAEKLFCSDIWTKVSQSNRS